MPAAHSTAAPRHVPAQEPAQDDAQCWEMKRNCSLSPRQLLSVFASLGAATLLLSMAFWAVGAPAMLPFAGVEVACLSMALFWHARHVGDREVLRLCAGRLEVRQQCANQLQCSSFDAAAIRVGMPRRAGALLELTAGGQRLLVGRHLRAEQRAALALELRQALRQQAALPNTNLEPQR